MPAHWQSGATVQWPMQAKRQLANKCFFLQMSRSSNKRKNGLAGLMLQPKIQGLLVTGSQTPGASILSLKHTAFSSSMCKAVQAEEGVAHSCCEPESLPSLRLLWECQSRECQPSCFAQRLS